MTKEKKEKIIKIAVTSIIAVLFIWFFFIYPFAYFKGNENKLEKAAKHYYEINYQQLPERDEVRTVSLSELGQQKYIEDLYIPYTSTVCSVDDSWVKVRKEGDGYRYYVYLKCGYLNSSVDHIGPEIKLKGESEITVTKGSKYKELGVESVYDKVDGQMKTSDVIIDKHDLDTSKLGTYKVTYTAYDSMDNETIVERTVKVVQSLSGIVENDTNKKGYYVGEVDNNYLRLSGMLFRIVNANNDGSVRIVADEDVASIDYNSIQNWLNNYYYAHLTEDAKSFLVDSTFCQDQLNQADLTTTECSDGGKKQKVGILSVEDYAKSMAAGNSYLFTHSMVWLANDKDDKQAWTARDWYVNTDAKYMEFSKNYSMGVRPVLTIKKDTLIKGGKGTLGNPYVLGDLTPAKSNDKLNTRYTGEYVEYGGYLFRILEANMSGTTKVILDGTLEMDDQTTQISYPANKEVAIYNPKQKGNVGYQIEHLAANYIKTDIFTKQEIEVPIYKDNAKYGKPAETKKYKVTFAAPSMHELFASEIVYSDKEPYWLRDSSQEVGRRFAVSDTGDVYYDKKYDMEAGIRVIAQMKKSAVILDGKGTKDDPYTLVED